jgi:cell division initiation protein
MITPFDIEKKEFSKGVRGYSIEEVDEFLDQIIVDLEKIIKENLRLKAEVVNLEQENEKLKGSEGEVVDVLQKAKSLMSDISSSAEKRAEVILKNAQLDAELTVREARDRSEKLLQENRFLEERCSQFKENYRRFLDSELERLQEAEDMFAPYDESKLHSLIDEPIGPEGDYSSPLDDAAVNQPAPVGQMSAVEDNSTDGAMVLDDLERELFGDDIAQDERKTVVMSSSDIKDR